MRGVCAKRVCVIVSKNPNESPYTNKQTSQLGAIMPQDRQSSRPSTTSRAASVMATAGATLRLAASTPR